MHGQFRGDVVSSWACVAALGVTQARVDGLLTVVAKSAAYLQGQACKWQLAVNHSHLCG